MTVRRIDPATGGIATSGQQFISGVDEIAQTIETRLRLFLGEYFRDTTEGTAWFQQVFAKNGTTSSKESVIRTRIAQTDGVIQLTSFETDFDVITRTYTVTAAVLTIYGEATINVTGIV